MRCRAMIGRERGRTPEGWFPHAGQAGGVLVVPEKRAKANLTIFRNGWKTGESASNGGGFGKLANFCSD